VSYELKQEDVYGLIASLNATTRQHGDEIQFKLCPYCYGGRHKDEWTFSINIETGLYNDARGSCAKKGHFVQLARDFGYKLDFDNEKKYV
jgi:twinkle protein